MDNFLVSIIIPVFNSEDYLAETIESAINQTWQNKEILLIDDGSTDNSLNIAKRYQCEWIKVFEQENKGASSARNYGLREAKGDYIQFLDADDLISSDKVKFQIELLADRKNHISICPIVYFKNGNDPYSIPVIHEWYSRGSDDPLDFLVKLYGGQLVGPNYGGMITIHSWLIPRNVIDKAGAWNESLSVDDDGEFFCRIVLNSDGILYSPDSINYYRKFVGERTTLSSQKSFNHLNSLLQSWQFKKRHLSKYNHPLLNLVIRRNFTELYYTFYNPSKELRQICLSTVLEMGGLTHKPFFGNQMLNSLVRFIGYKNCFLIQKIANGMNALRIRKANYS